MSNCKWSGSRAPKCGWCGVELCRIEAFSDWKCPMCHREWDQPTGTTTDDAMVGCVGTEIDYSLCERIKNAEKGVTRSHSDLFSTGVSIKEVEPSKPIDPVPVDALLGRVGVMVDRARLGNSEPEPHLDGRSNPYLGLLEDVARYDPGASEVNAPKLAITEAQARAQGGLVGHVQLADGVILPVTIPGVEGVTGYHQGVTARLYVPLQVSQEEPKDDWCVRCPNCSDEFRVTISEAGSTIRKDPGLREEAVELVEQVLAYTTVRNALLHECPGRRRDETRCDCGVTLAYERKHGMWVFRCAGDQERGLGPCDWYAMSMDSPYLAARVWLTK